MKSWFCIAAVLFSHVISVRAQDFSFVNYAFNEGLYHSQITDIAQDTHGNLWLLPLGGNRIYRFDGREFKSYGIDVEGITTQVKPYFIECDHKENLWLLTNEGVVKFDGKDFTLMKSAEPTEVSYASRLFVAGDGSVWVIDNHTSVLNVVDNRLVRLDLKGTGFIERNNKVLLWSRDGKITDVTSGNPTALPWLGGQSFRQLFQQGDDYLAVLEKTIVHHNPATRVTSTFQPFGIDLGRISQMVYFNGSVIVLGGGVARILTNTGVYPISEESDLTPVAFFKIFRDRANTIWLGADAKGIFRMSRREMMHVPMPGNDIVVSLQPYEGKVIAGTYRSGIVEIDGTRVRKLPAMSVDGTVVMTLVSTERNGLLVGTQKKGAYVVTPSKRIIPLVINEPPVSQFVLPVAEYGNDIWLGSAVGVHRFSNSFRNTDNYSYSELGTTSYLNVIFPLDNSLLLGTALDGLFSFDPSMGKAVRVESVSKGSTLYDVRRHSDGTIWLSGEFPQLLVLNDRLDLVKTLDVSQYCANIGTFEFLNDTELLLGANDGILRLSLDKNGDIDRVKRLRRADGFNGGEITIGSMARIDDSIWFGTTHGAYHYSLNPDSSSVSKPFTYINSIRLFNQETDWSEHTDSVGGFYHLPQHLVLDHDKNNLTFSFYGNDFEDNQDLQFHYWLEGVENGWSNFSTVENISYSNLAPGDYSFHVQATDGTNTGNTASFSFTIRPAFWQTAAFYWIAVAAVIVVAYAGARYISFYRLHTYRRKEQLRASEIAKFRKQMAMDFHDEMGNKLASILAYSSLLKHRSTTEENRSLFDHFETVTSAIYTGTRDFIWSIDVESNNLREVLIYIRNFGVEFFEKHNIEFHVSCDLGHASFDTVLQEGTNRQLILLFKEAMTNVLKHSGATKVYFDADADNGHYKITLSDNGAGIENKGGGKGLASMTARAARISGQVQVTARPEGGTTVVLNFRT